MAFSMALLTSRAGADFLGAGAAQRAVSVSATPTSPGFAAEADPGFRPPARDARRVARSFGGYATQPLRPGLHAVVGFNKGGAMPDRDPPHRRNGNRRTRLST